MLFPLISEYSTSANKIYLLMQLPSEFSKMQFLITGNRFTGMNLVKTTVNFDYRQGTQPDQLLFAAVFSTEIDYLEVEDQVKYLQHATVELGRTVFTPDQLVLLRAIVLQQVGELRRRYETSHLFKLLELPVADSLREEDIDRNLLRMIADIAGGKQR